MKKRLKITLIIVVALIIFIPPFARYQVLRWKSRKLELQMIALKEEAKRLEDEKRKLETDISYVERKARERIGVAKKGEIILKETPTRK